MLNFCATRVGTLKSRKKIGNVIVVARCLRVPFAQSYSLNANTPKGAPKFPELLYFPKLFRWLGMKFKLKYLQRAWDAEFSEGAFIYGSTRAICRITEIIQANDVDKLNNLLTAVAAEQLRHDVMHKLTTVQRKIIRLTPADIKLLVPIKVQLVKDNEDVRRCFIMLKSLSMKWYQDNHNVKLVLIVIDTEFTREFSDSRKSEWFISIFNIVQCALIGGQPANRLQ